VRRKIALAGRSPGEQSCSGFRWRAENGIRTVRRGGWQEAHLDQSKEANMAVALLIPLLGLFVWFLFAAAAWALPIFLGLSAAFAADHAGASGATSLLIGFGIFVATVVGGRTLLTTLPARGPARIAIMLLFALPAAAATASVSASLSRVVGIDEWAVVVVAIIGAVLGGFAGARVLEQPAT